MRNLKFALAALLLGFGGPLLAYDVNGVSIGASEADVKKTFPSALCKPLEWSSPAADRRCDDAKISIGGIESRITFYLKKNAVEAFDVRFDMKDLEGFKKHTKSRYGKPLTETTDTIERQGKLPRQVYKARWEKGPEHAILVAQLEQKRGSLTVSRGDFEEAIYRVK
jgi:hypothetical protein